MNKNPKFFGSEVYRKAAFGSNHPLTISRQGAVVDVVRELDWLPVTNYCEAEIAPVETLLRFHDPNYVENLRAADQLGSASAEQVKRYNFGTMENPLFRGVFERASITVGASIAAASYALDHGVAFHPGGGTHHGRSDHASGFCYFNDPVFAIFTLLDGGVERVAYVDLDAHHGDGVEAAFRDDSRVMTISIHEENRWPYSGAHDDRTGEYARNAAVPQGFNDTELQFLMDEAVSPLLAKFAPQAMVITCGADALEGDPLSRMELSNIALQQAVMQLCALTPSTVILGGGGYNPWTTVRCWSGLWGKLAGFKAPERLPAEIVGLFKSFECDLVDDDDIDPKWLLNLTDNRHEGPVREAVKGLARILSAP